MKFELRVRISDSAKSHLQGRHLHVGVEFLLFPYCYLYSYMYVCMYVCACAQLISTVCAYMFVCVCVYFSVPVCEDMDVMLLIIIYIHMYIY